MAAAVHEAGHAIVGIVLKRRVTGAILRPPHGLSGETQVEDTSEWLNFNKKEDRHRAEDHVTFVYAGQLAEAVHWAAHSHLYRPLVDTHRDDDNEIDRTVAALEFPPEEEAKYRAHCIAKAKGILEDARVKAALEEIAQMLFDTMKITRDELDEVLIKHGILKNVPDPEPPV